MAEFLVRDSSPADNRSLIELTLACPMQGDVGLCVDRSPDFFQLSRLEGERWKVGVAEGGGEVMGCVGAAERHVYLNGRPTSAMYAGDLKVHPRHRNHAVAEALIRYAVAQCERNGGRDVPVFGTVLAGNRPAENWLAGNGSTPRFERIATLNAASISLLWKKRMPANSMLRIDRATRADLDEMADLWQHVAPLRQLAPVYDARSLERWIEESAGLDYSSYFLARDPRNALLGFVGFWDQDSFKHMLVTRYSPRLKVARGAYNLVSRLFGAAKLPPAGGAMRYMTAVNICVPGDRAEVLRSILIAAMNEFHGRYPFLTLGLDVSDPLTAAWKGLLPQPLLVNAYISSPSGGYRGPALDGRPVHFEIALV